MRHLKFFAALALAGWGASAAAATHVVVATINPAIFRPSLENEVRAFVPLDTPLTLQVGDQIDVTLNFPGLINFISFPGISFGLQAPEGTRSNITVSLDSSNFIDYVGPQLFRGRNFDSSGSNAISLFVNGSPLFEDSGMATSISGVRASATIIRLQSSITGEALSSVLFDRVFASAAVVPEPGQWVMLLSGFGMIGGALRIVRQASRLRRVVT